MKALIDCNNFFVSCERVFDPALKDRSVAVLSSNDGCVIARSNDIKPLIPMGVPVFKVRDILKHHNVIVRSSNFALYSDMSRRVMATLRQFTPDIAVYSIDEAFLAVDGLVDYASWGGQVRERVRRDTGIPVSVGIATTRTLAKAAATLAKRSHGVLAFADMEQVEVDTHLQRLPVGEVWGVGRRLERRFRQQQVTTAYGLQQLSDRLLEGHNVTVRRMVLELRGIPAETLVRHHSKSMVSTRSFSRLVWRQAELAEALSTHAVHLGAKLRRERLAASLLVAVLSTGKGGVYHRASVKLPVATSDSRLLSQAARCLLPEMYRSNTAYKKAGVMVYRLVPNAAIQLDFEANPGQLHLGERVNHALDTINAKWGRHAIRLAAEGLAQPWQPKHGRRSPRYTTEWAGLKTVQ